MLTIYHLFISGILCFFFFINFRLDIFFFYFSFIQTELLQFVCLFFFLLSLKKKLVTVFLITFPWLSCFFFLSLYFAEYSGHLFNVKKKTTNVCVIQKGNCWWYSENERLILQHKLLLNWKTDENCFYFLFFSFDNNPVYLKGKTMFCL